MINPNYYCVIMAGGIGARFWPLSKTATPKQFIDIIGDGSTLIQKTYSRFEKICLPENIYVVTNIMYCDTVKAQLPALPEENIVLEAARRNTAPCIAYANYKIKKKNPNAVIVVAPSDHVIQKEDVFIEVIKSGMSIAAESDNLLTIGVRPSFPHTGYGYIQYEEDMTYKTQNAVYKVKTFTEKPALEMARQFIECGDFLWNAGIFMWSLSTIEKAFEQFLPEINDLFKQGMVFYNTRDEKDFIHNIYQVCRNISIDYGIMEKARNVYVCAAEFGWSDLGTWGSLYDMRSKDENGNAIIGRQVKTYNTHRCIINMPKNKVAVIQGMEDYIIVDHDNVLLVCKKEDEQQIRQYVNDVQVDFGDKYV